MQQKDAFLEDYSYPLDVSNLLKTEKQRIKLKQSAY